MASDLIEVQHRGALYLPEADLWLDPRFPVGRAFVSHAHADHVAKHRQTFASEVTGMLMGKRFGANKDGVFRGLAFGEEVEWEGWRLRVLPAGHIVGSAMLHLTRLRDGATLLYTGDYKLTPGLSSERCELRAADTLIMECTFGLPHFRFPPREETLERVRRFVTETLEDGGIPVLLGYSLGKAQEILCGLAGMGVPVMVHKSIQDMTRVVADLVGPLPEYRLFDAADAKGHVLVFPPSAARSQMVRRLKVCRTAMLSGWGLESGASYRYQVDEVFPLSDHADYEELIETVEKVRPRRVYVVHGYTQAFAADLRRRGWDGWTLEGADQMELAMEVGSGLAEVDEDVGAAQADAAVGGERCFGRWVAAAEGAAAESSRLGKRRGLAAYLGGLEEREDLALAVRYFSGRTGTPLELRRPLQVGWALIRQVLQEISGLSQADYRAISRTQNDSGRTAFLVLSRAELPAGGDVTIMEVAGFFAALRGADGPMRRVGLLREMLRRMSAREGSWLVRLLTGGLRMGSKEGLVEEAVAEAFERSVDEVRAAAMLGGDLGEAAVMAREGRLAEACPVPLVPLKVMLASPEETAEGIWERLGDAGGSDGGVWLEDKFDGIRAQLHCGGSGCEVFSRDLKPVGAQFPELLRAAEGLEGEVILDGEVIAYAEDQRLSFFDLQKRLGRRDQVDLFLGSDVTVRYVVFDVLLKDGVSLLDRSLVERRAVLESLALPEGMTRIEVMRAGSTEEIEAAFLASRRRGNEGLIAKDGLSPYSPGRRGKAWLKLKKAFSTLDVVVVKVQQGHGKRSHVLSDYTFAVLDEATGELKTIGKAYSGLTDLEIEELTEHFTRQTLSQKGQVRTVVPDTVLEIAFDSIQPSQRHESGLALRFPRIKAIRRDKTPGEIDTLERARRLAGLG